MWGGGWCRHPSSITRWRSNLRVVPTSFKLPGQTVDLLRASAAQFLMASESFKKGMQNLDPEWMPRDVNIDPGRIDAVCKKSEGEGAEQ